MKKVKLNKPKFVPCCPVCNNFECTESLDFPDTVEECTHCGSEWNISGELIFDVRDLMSYDEIVAHGYCIDLNNK